MICPVCGGSGITRVQILDVVHTLPARCGGCNGTGVLPDPDGPDDATPTLDRMIARKVEVLEAISEEPNLPADLKRRWYDRLDAVGVTEPDAEAALRGLQKEIDEAEGELPGCYLALIYSGLGELARMSADYRRLSAP